MEEILNLLNPWWIGKWVEKSIPREVYTQIILSHLEDRLVGILIGSRRVGKTTILHQAISLLLQKGVKASHVLYVLLDHPKFSEYSLSRIIEEYRRLNDLNRDTRIFIFLDEIQYAKNWEQEVKALVDTEAVKIFVSGSSSTLISQKQAFLTGRYYKQVVEPLSFKEFLKFRSIKIAKTEMYRYQTYLKEYLQTGGYPEYVLLQNPQYFADLTEAVIFKDIVSLYGVRNPQLVRDLLLLLSDRCGHQTSFTKMGKILSLSTDTAREYVEYLKQTFLVSELKRFALSRNKQLFAAKKFYLNDTGLLFNLAGKLNIGSSFEQVLFHCLSQKYKRVFFYYENQQEVDFVVDKGEESILVESKHELGLEREKIENQLVAISNQLKIKQVIIVNKDIEEKFTKDRIVISYLPLWKMLLWVS